MKSSLIVATGLVTHNLGELLLAQGDQSFCELDIFFTHADVNMVFQQFDHALNDELLEHIMVDLGVACETLGKLRLSLRAQLFNAVVSLLHALQACLVNLTRDFDLLFDIERIDLLLELPVQVVGSLLYKFVAFLFEDALAKHVDFECFFVSLLSHHALELEGIGVQKGHFFNNNQTKRFWSSLNKKVHEYAPSQLPEVLWVLKAFSRNFL